MDVDAVDAYSGHLKQGVENPDRGCVAVAHADVVSARVGVHLVDPPRAPAEVGDLNVRDDALREPARSAVRQEVPDCRVAAAWRYDG